MQDIKPGDWIYTSSGAWGYGLAADDELKPFKVKELTTASLEQYPSLLLYRNFLTITDSRQIVVRTSDIKLLSNQEVKYCFIKSLVNWYV